MSDYENDERNVSACLTSEDSYENILRPKSLDEYIGQSAIKENLKIFIEAARKRGQPIDHILLYGPPGLGKTTLAQIIANQMGSTMVTIAGPSITKPLDIIGPLTGLSEGETLFIDEIHRLHKTTEETMYSAMEDFKIGTTMGIGAGTEFTEITLNHFTIIGATTKYGMMSAPLRDRFGIVFRLEMYTVEELYHIISRSAEILGARIDADAAYEIARRSRGTPRIANRLLKRTLDFADIKGEGIITNEVAVMALDALKVDTLGLDITDRKLLEAMIMRFRGKPVGLETLAAATNEDSGTIEDVYEPYLLQQALIEKTPRGRIPTKLAYDHLGIPFNDD